MRIQNIRTKLWLSIVTELDALLATHGAATQIREVNYYHGAWLQSITVPPSEEATLRFNTFCMALSVLEKAQADDAADPEDGGWFSDEREAPPAFKSEHTWIAFRAVPVKARRNAVAEA